MATGTKDYEAITRAPFGMLGIRTQDGRLTGIDLLNDSARAHTPKVGVAREAVEQLKQYFTDPRFRFSLPMTEQGTGFQQTVWKALRAIPGGKPSTYGELANRLGSSPRAVGGACRRNPIPIVTPCHRVVAKDHAGGFMGQTDGPALRMKQWLLEHEAND